MAGTETGVNRTETVPHTLRFFAVEIVRTSSSNTLQPLSESHSARGDSCDLKQSRHRESLRNTAGSGLPGIMLGRRSSRAESRCQKRSPPLKRLAKCRRTSRKLRTPRLDLSVSRDEICLRKLRHPQVTVGRFHGNLSAGNSHPPAWCERRILFAGFGG